MKGNQLALLILCEEKSQQFSQLIFFSVKKVHYHYMTDFKMPFEKKTHLFVVHPNIACGENFHFGKLEQEAWQIHVLDSSESFLLEKEQLSRI